jgi:ATP-binding protein involved in chromosome partitioning
VGADERRSKVLTSAQEIQKVVEELYILGFEKSLGDMGMVKEVNAEDGRLSIVLASAALGEDTKEKIRKTVTIAASRFKDIKSTEVSFVSATGAMNRVRNVIAIMSGKGGVGKSLVSGLAAVALRRAGNEVGILDADITGPSIPKMFGITDRPESDESGMIPVKSKSGIAIMSINLLLPDEDDAVVWRGPLIAGAIRQFWEEVRWGSLDYLIVDLPPGTADAPLTVLQSLPVTGIIMVSTPQQLTSMVVRKALKMAQRMNKPIIGVVENMSYLYIPEIKKKMEIFGRPRGGELALAAGAPLLAQLPIDPTLARLCDEGKIESYESESYAVFADNLAAAVAKSDKPGHP